MQCHIFSMLISKERKKEVRYWPDEFVKQIKIKVIHLHVSSPRIFDPSLEKSKPKPNPAENCNGF